MAESASSPAQLRAHRLRRFQFLVRVCALRLPHVPECASQAPRVVERRPGALSLGRPPLRDRGRARRVYRDVAAFSHRLPIRRLHQARGKDGQIDW